MIDRHAFANELLLREHIRNAIKVVLERKKQKNMEVLQEEEKLRTVIRELILTEAAASGGTPETPHRSTGINVLEDLLKKIVPILEQEYKILTTNEEQRQSYRAHILNAAQNALAPEIAIKDAGTPGDEELNEVEVDVGDAADEDAFIDVRGEDTPEAEDEMTPEEEFGQGLDGDVTGRNLAYKSFQKVEKAIVDAYAVLSDDADREVFYDYLLTNLKLYFDKFEEELIGEIGEPTTPEYEQEKQDQELEGPPAEEGEPAAEEPELEL
jgi:hypothetical protein